MDTTVVIGILVIVAVGAVAGTVPLYEWLKSRKQGYPYEDVIEPVLLPWAYDAISAGFYASQWTMDEFGSRLHGAGKAAIARSVYALLPESLTVRGVAIPVKSVVTEEQFARTVQKAFDRFLAFYDTNRAGFEGLAKAWLEANK